MRRQNSRTMNPSAGAARTGRSRLEGGKESKGREICGGGLIRQKKGLVSLRLSLGSPGLRHISSPKNGLVPLLVDRAAMPE